MAIAAVRYVLSFHEISFAREDDTVSDGQSRKEADLNSGASGYLDEVTLQYKKVMDDDFFTTDPDC